MTLEVFPNEHLVIFCAYMIIINWKRDFYMVCVICMYYIYIYMRAETTTRDHDSQPGGCEWATRSRVGSWAETGWAETPLAYLMLGV